MPAPNKSLIRGFGFFTHDRNVWVWLAMTALIILVAYAGAVEADIPKPKLPEGADENDIVSVITAYFKKIISVAMVILLVVAFVVAAYAGVVALYRLVTGRDDWGALLGVFFAALVVLAFVGFILYEGDQTLKTVLA